MQKFWIKVSKRKCDKNFPILINKKNEINLSLTIASRTIYSPSNEIFAISETVFASWLKKDKCVQLCDQNVTILWMCNCLKDETKKFLKVCQSSAFLQVSSKFSSFEFSECRSGQSLFIFALISICCLCKLPGTFLKPKKETTYSLWACKTGFSWNFSRIRLFCWDRINFAVVKGLEETGN